MTSLKKLFLFAWNIIGLINAILLTQVPSAECQPKDHHNFFSIFQSYHFL